MCVRDKLGFPVCCDEFSLVFYILRMPGIFKVVVLFTAPFLLFHFRLVFIRTKIKLIH